MGWTVSRHFVDIYSTSVKPVPLSVVICSATSGRNVSTKSTLDVPHHSPSISIGRCKGRVPNLINKNRPVQFLLSRRAEQ